MKEVCRRSGGSRTMLRGLCLCGGFLLSVAVAATGQASKPSSPGTKTAVRQKRPARTKPATSIDWSYDLVEKSQTSVQALNLFGVQLTAKLARQHPQKNIFISPLSVFAALAMTESGAAGQTRDDMRKAMSVLSDVSEERLHESTAALLKTLPRNSGTKLLIANALWSDTRTPVSPAFSERSRELYQAEVRSLDLSRPEAASAINTWVNQKTGGKIPAIVTPNQTRNAGAIITNAVYFQGGWSEKFDKRETRSATFHLPEHREKTVFMMHQPSISDAYRSGAGFEAAALSYERSGMVLYVILPDPGIAPEAALANVNVSRLGQRSERNELDLRLPRFTIDFSASLEDSLTGMGMGTAFHPGADFTGFSHAGFFIGDVWHVTRLEVDEEGTVAAAATSLGVLGGVSPPQVIHKRVLVVDRPFALLLCDRSTTAIIFSGVVYDPAP